MAGPDHRDTRTRILDATVRCLVELGYDGTTTAAVQSVAGVSRGALMHHFPTKTALLVGAVRHLAGQRGANLRRQALELPGGDDRLGPAVDLLWDVFQGPLFAASLELWTAARTDPALREAVYQVERGLKTELDRAAVDLFGPRLAALPDFGEAIELTVQFLRGAAMTAVLRRNPERQRALIDRWKSMLAGWLTPEPSLQAGP